MVILRLAKKFFRKIAENNLYRRYVIEILQSLYIYGIWAGVNWCVCLVATDPICFSPPPHITGIFLGYTLSQDQDYSFNKRTTLFNRN